MTKNLNLRPKTALAGLIIVAIAPLSGCTQYLNHQGVELEIAHTFKTQTGLSLDSLTCPEKEPVKPGRVFACEGTLAGGQVVPLTVTQLDQSGKISWDAKASLNNLKGIVDNERLALQITEGIKTQTQIDVVTDCGELFRVARKGEVFTCITIDHQENQMDVMVKAQDDEGNVSWEL